MKISESIIKILEYNRGKYVSGETLAEELKVSRNCIWKNIRKLNQTGYCISAVTNKGYKLDDECCRLSSFAFEKLLKTKGVSVIYTDSCGSTNSCLKELAENGQTEKTVYISGEQTCGRGRMSRSFYSPCKTGLYMSLLLRPSLSADKALEITTAAAVAICRVLRKYTDKTVGIKWVNDIYLNMKKVCGILTEASVDVENGMLKYAILGIGINLSPPENGFPEGVNNIADAVFEKPLKPQQICQIACEIIDGFLDIYPLIGTCTLVNEYRDYSILPGRNIYVINGDEHIEAVALGINDDYSLLAKFADGSTASINSGDVSIRMKPLE